MDTFDIWDENNDTIKKIYAKDNYEEIILNPKKKKCYIFFSSNGLYYPNTKEEFQKKIIQQNRYEWKKISEDKRIKESAGKYIFIRDIYKQWYVTGINSRIHSIDRLAELLRTLTVGYEVTCVGSSAGGYVATLIGVLIHAEKVINFSGQFSLEEGDFIQKYKEQPERSKYYRLRDWISQSNVPIYYFLPAYSQEDIDQYSTVEGIPELKVVKFGEKNHAATMFASNMAYVIVLESKEIEELYQKYQDMIVNKIRFLFETEGIRKGFVLFLKECYYALRRKKKEISKALKKG